MKTPKRRARKPKPLRDRIKYEGVVYSPWLDVVWVGADNSWHFSQIQTQTEEHARRLIKWLQAYVAWAEGKK
jgi:hypothetical protein